MLGCHSLLVHAAAESLDVVADVSNHAVPLVPLGCLLALVRGRAVAAPPRCSVAVGGGVRGGAGCAAVAPEAVCDDPSAILDANGLEEILKVLAVFLWYERTQACGGQRKAVNTDVHTDTHQDMGVL